MGSEVEGPSIWVEETTLISVEMPRVLPQRARAERLARYDELGDVRAILVQLHVCATTSDPLLG